MTQKKHRITPEDIDLKELRRDLKKQFGLARLKELKAFVEDGRYLCEKCLDSCPICKVIYPKATGPVRCPCHVYLKKDVAQVANYLLLNLKI